MNKKKLKEILNYQYEVYEQIITEYSDMDPEIIEIIVTDCVYQEHGFDREAIRAAIKALKIRDDEEFKEIVKKLEALQNQFLDT